MSPAYPINGSVTTCGGEVPCRDRGTAITSTR